MAATEPIEISGAPTAEEVAAIVAAHEALWPRPVLVDDTPATTPAWRFSGRWWQGGSGRPRW